MSSRNVILHITIASMLIALIAIFSFVPYIGFITIGPISFTTVHVIVLIGCMLLGRKHGLIYGFFFGLFSFIQALQYPGTVNYLFVNPFVSILPRILFGLVAGLVFDFLRKRCKKSTFIGISAVSAGLLTLFHTFITLTCLYIFGILDIFKISQALGLSEVLDNLKSLGFDNFGLFILGFVSFGCIAEVIGAAIIVPSAGGVIYKVFGHSNFVTLGVIKNTSEENSLSKTHLIILFVCAGIVLLGFLAGLIVLYSMGTIS